MEHKSWEPPDTRRWLQLCLGALWLLDAELQYQAFMFTRSFGQMLAGTAHGNPAVIADPILWSARIIEAHPGPANALFATVQLLLGLGIIWRPAVRAALAASVVWSVAVWWLGEGLGGVLSGDASPVSGGPGAVILYALLAVLLWPARPDTGAPFEAARAVGPRGARLLWAALWGSMAWFTVMPAASRTAQGLHDTLSATASGEPPWLAAIGDGAANAVAGNGLPVSVALAAVLAAIAIGIYAPRPVARAAVALAVATALVLWVVGQDLGEIFTGAATDIQSGPMLILLAVAYWPQAPAARAFAPLGRPVPSEGS